MSERVERLLSKPETSVIARVVLTFPFWMSGISKQIDFEAGAAEMARVGLEPAALFNISTVVLQLTGSLLVIVGRHAWLGAGALGVFTGLTALLVHNFWSITEEPFRTIALHTASEHVGIIGSLLAIAIQVARLKPQKAVCQTRRASESGATDERAIHPGRVEWF